MDEGRSNTQSRGDKVLQDERQIDQTEDKGLQDEEEKKNSLEKKNRCALDLDIQSFMNCSSFVLGYVQGKDF